MFTNSKLTKSIRLAIAAGAASTVMTMPNLAVAQEAENNMIEKISVTGSRIKRSDMEGASPVISITAADIKLEGDFSVADALRSSSLNSFGSFSERSGSSAQSQATIDLRGAGSQRTLVLLDGRRFPGSPTLGGSSANLNAIPMAAVERIDIMTEGASSVYGSDAMAGVVNVILKKNVEGITFSVGVGQRDQDEGTTSNEFSILGGFSTDKGNVTFAFDHQMRKGISDGARDYTKARAADLNNDGAIQIYTDETSGWSWYGASVFNSDRSQIKSSLLCDELIAQYGSDTFQEFAMDDAYSPGSTVCGFAFANVSYNTASINRNTLYVNADYEVTEDVQWFGQAMFVQNSSFGRYAPPAAPWSNMTADNPHNPWGEEGVSGNFRWVGIGNRDNNVDDYNQDYLFGFRGDLDWANASWEVGYHYNNADNKSVGEYYLSYGGLAYNLANDIDLGSDEGIANMKATTAKSSKAKFNQYYAGLSFEMFDLAGGVAGHYIGGEFMEQTYADIYDGQSEAGLVGGSSGNSAQGERDITAIFYEGAFPVTDKLELNVAVRYDDYSDFGDNVAPSAKVRYEVTEGLVLRASYSESFRAPALDELNAATTFSAESAIDYFNGNTSSQQYNTYYKSNPNLEAETSDYINLGVVWDVNDNFGVKLDYFELAIDNVIQTKSVQDLIADEAAGLITALGANDDTSSETFYLKRAPAGALIEAGTGYNNGVGFEIHGVDLSLSGNLDTSVGDFRLSMVNSFVLEYNEEVANELQDTIGRLGKPEFKTVLTLAWFMQDHTVSWNTTYTDSTSDNDNSSKSTLADLDSWTIHNLTYSYDAGQYGTLSLTINNLLDEDPVLSNAGVWEDQDLYSNFGRDYRLGYSISF